MSKKNKKKLKIKKRRSITSEELFKKKETQKMIDIDFLLRRDIPDPEERQEYIKALIKGLEEEPCLEIL